MLQRLKLKSNWIKVHEDGELVLVNLNHLLHISRREDGRAFLASREARECIFADESFEEVAELMAEALYE